MVNAQKENGLFKEIIARHKIASSADGNEKRPDPHYFSIYFDDLMEFSNS